MLLFIKEPITKDQLKEVSKDLDGYVKFVVDVERKILTAGGLRHVDGEQMLLQDGSKQNNLWGGGWDIDSDELDFDSMINIRPAQGNSSREVLSEEIRNQISDVVNKLLRVL